MTSQQHGATSELMPEFCKNLNEASKDLEFKKTNDLVLNQLYKINKFSRTESSFGEGVIAKLYCTTTDKKVNIHFLQ